MCGPLFVLLPQALKILGSGQSDLLSCCSVAQSEQTLQPHELQYARFPYASPSPGVCSNSTHIHRVDVPSNHLILCHSLLSSIFPSISIFSNESALRIRWPTCWSFSFSISPSSEYLGLISFRIDWLELLAVQRTLKSLLQNNNLKALVLQYSAFFMVLIPMAPDCWKNYTAVLSHSVVSDSATLWTIACRAPLSMGFSRQEYRSGLPCSPPRDLSNLRIEPISHRSPELASGLPILALPGKP